MTFVLAAGSREQAVSRAEAASTCVGAERAGQTLATAAAALDELAFLLRRMRSVAVAATGTGSRSQTRLWQEQLHTLVVQVAAVTAEAVVAGVPVFGGQWSSRPVRIGSAGPPVEVDIAPLDARVLGIEQPWGYATRAQGPPARLVTATGVLPEGLFVVRRGQVVDVTGMPVGTVQGRRVDFHSGACATFDRSPSYRDEGTEAACGCLTFTSVLSVRSREAAQGAVAVIGDAIAEVSRRRKALEVCRVRLEAAVTSCGVGRETRGSLG